MRAAACVLVRRKPVYFASIRRTTPDPSLLDDRLYIYAALRAIYPSQLPMTLALLLLREHASADNPVSPDSPQRETRRDPLDGTMQNTLLCPRTASPRDQPRPFCTSRPARLPYPERAAPKCHPRNVSGSVPGDASRQPGRMKSIAGGILTSPTVRLMNPSTHASWYV